MKEMKSNRESLHARALGWRAAIARAVLPAVLGASLVGPASAAVVFDQPPADGNDAFPSITAAQSAGGFRLSTTTAVTGLWWWGSYLEDPADPATPLRKDEFSVQIFADDGSGAPAANPGETMSQQPTRFSTSLLDQTGAPVYRFELVLAPVTLTGGKDWYLSVVNQFDILDASAGWYWLLSDTKRENFYRFVDGDPWLSQPTGNLAFRVIGNPETAIPLPGTLLLLLCGLAGLRVARSAGHARGVGGLEVRDVK
jgi:hypothetical protein